MNVCLGRNRWAHIAGLPPPGSSHTPQAANFSLILFFSSLLLQAVRDSLVPTGWLHMGSLTLLGRALSGLPSSPCRSHIWLFAAETCVPATPPPPWWPPSSHVPLGHSLCPISFYPGPLKSSPDTILPSLITPVTCHSPFCPQWHHVDLMRCHLS